MYVVSDLAGQVSCQPGKRRLLILDQFVDDQNFLKKLNHTFLKKNVLKMLSRKLEIFFKKRENVNKTQLSRF